MHGNDLVGMVAIVCVFGIPIIGMICHYGHLAFKSWQEIALKRDMVARGYTAQEIIGVVGGERENRSKSPLPNVPPAKPVKQAAY
jgi:hypothetical protein